MNSRGKKAITPKRNVSPKVKSSSGKENPCKTLSRVSSGQSKSGKRVEDMINDMRISACRTITNVKSSFGGFSYKLRQSTLKTRKFSKNQSYEELDEKVTPVKLYSPFTFVTPSPVKSSRKKVSPKRFSFSSPTGKFKKDVKELTRDVKELERLEKALSMRKFR